MMPDLSNPDHPDRTAWEVEVRALIADSDTSNLTVIAHSLGVTTALDYIESLSAPLHALISVSGFAFDYGAELNSYFLREHTIDLNKVRTNILHSAVFYGDDDPYVPQSALAALAEGLGVEPVVIPRGGHLNTDAGYTTFPALLDTVLGMADS